jgi:hypothetical protein
MRARSLWGGNTLSIKKKCIFSFIVVSALAVLLYSATHVVRTCKFYLSLKRTDHGWRGRVHVADPVLGFSPVPNSRGAEILPCHTEIPARFDGRGFRVPAGDTQVGTLAPRAIALGCSFTYGAACLAEETYPYLLSKECNLNCVNAGVCSYGLSQILLRAQSLIPKYKPDYVIVQYSPWLVLRSQNYYLPSDAGALPGPYFAESQDGLIYIHAPIFMEKVTELPVSMYRDTPKSTVDFSSFLFQVGVPLYLHDDVRRLSHEIKRLAGVTPRPITDSQRIVDYVYGEIERICEENNATMMILILGNRSHVLNLRGALVVDAQAALIGRLPERSAEAYREAYCHWSGSPPVCVDEHPNARAHRIIAVELAKTIRMTGN